MKIENRKTSELKPYSKNAKKHPESQVKKLADMIARVGFIQPIVVDEDDVVIIGHGRLEAAAKLELETVPTVKLSALSKAEARALRIFDNKIAIQPWEDDNLKFEITELSLMENFDFDLTGFDLEDSVSDFVPDLPDDAPSESKPNTDIILRVTFDDEDSQQELFEELRDRGFRVKV